ncbi:MAG: O-acetylhomoserine aminocarboxypropyltransferase/cysteine synthase family protein [Deinococcales bacterium]
MKPGHNFETLAVQEGIPRGHGVSIGTPIHAAAAFQFETLEDMADVFQGREEGLQYTRIQNPTLAALETRLTALENARGAVVTSSGQAATLLALITLARAGDHIVGSQSLFGGSLGLLNNVLPNFGIHSALVPNALEAFREAIKDNTKAILVEVISNPSCEIPDFAGLVALAQEKNIALIVDNTWGAVGAVCRPLELGADLVVHSLTKWASGHGAVLGGAVLSRNGYLPNSAAFLEPDATGQSLNSRYGDKAFLLRARYLGLHQMGMTLAAHSAWQIQQGLETVALRVQREAQTTSELAAWLEAHEAVAWVSHTSLPAHPHFENAKRYLKHQPCVLAFGVKGGLAGASACLRSLSLVRLAANLGDTRTLAAHPWTTTHGRLTEPARHAAGVHPEMIRLTVGLEHLEDLKADLGQALHAALEVSLASA